MGGMFAQLLVAVKLMSVVSYSGGRDNRCMTTETTAATPPPPAPKRRGPMRVVKWVLLTIVLLILVALGVVYFYLNTIVKNVVVKQSSHSLNTTTSLDSASVSLFGGKVSLKEFQVNSPSG